MRRSRFRATLLVAVLLAPAAQADPARFTGTLRLLVSVGTDPNPAPLLSVTVAGTADVTGSVVRIPAGAIHANVPPIAGFGGSLVNGAATFFAGGAGAGSTCPLLALQEVCIDGGGFGGAMRLAGITHQGQALSLWGLSGMGSGATASGLLRTERAELWTAGQAAAWFFIPELDATPFVLSGAGTHRGLPGSAGDEGGFSLVAPVIVTAPEEAGSASNVRGLAELRIAFAPPPVPIGAAALLATAVVLTAAWHLHRRSAK